MTRKGIKCYENNTQLALLVSLYSDFFHED